MKNSIISKFEAAKAEWPRNKFKSFAGASMWWLDGVDSYGYNQDRTEVYQLGYVWRVCDETGEDVCFYYLTTLSTLDGAQIKERSCVFDDIGPALKFIQRNFKKASKTLT